MAIVADLRSKFLGQSDSDALVLFDPVHIRWACGFSGSNGILIITSDTVLLLTDGRYEIQAQEQTPDLVDVQIVQKVDDALASSIGRMGLAEVLIDDRTISHRRLLDIRDRLQSVSWRPCGAELDVMAASKDEPSLQKIRNAIQNVESALLEVTSRPVIGRTEAQLAAELQFEMIAGGAESVSFNPLVASGPNSAKPHARPTQRQITYGDVLLIDCGSIVDGFASDITRTFFVGQAQSKAREIYEIVLEANQLGIDNVRSGRKGADLDALIRRFFADVGLDKYYAHSLGHGVGMNVHEWPSLSGRADDVLPDRAVVTIEPGLYFPDQFGVRIEDMVYLPEESAPAITLTSVSKELQVLTR